jgi:hypothetical protein
VINVVLIDKQEYYLYDQQDKQYDQYLQDNSKDQFFKGVFKPGIVPVEFFAGNGYQCDGGYADTIGIEQDVQDGPKGSEPFGIGHDGNDEPDDGWSQKVSEDNGGRRGRIPAFHLNGS